MASADERQMVDPEAERIAEDLLKVERAREAVIKADGPLSAQDRAQTAEATRKAEAAYLEGVGGSVEAWRASARENGRAD